MNWGGWGGARGGGNHDHRPRLPTVAHGWCWWAYFLVCLPPCLLPCLRSSCPQLPRCGHVTADGVVQRTRSSVVVRSSCMVLALCCSFLLFLALSRSFSLSRVRCERTTANNGLATRTACLANWRDARCPRAQHVTNTPPHLPSNKHVTPRRFLVSQHDATWLGAYLVTGCRALYFSCPATLPRPPQCETRRTHANEHGQKHARLVRRVASAVTVRPPPRAHAA